MTNTKKIGIAATIFLTILFWVFYIALENFFYSDFGCGCSSGCVGYYPTFNSKIVGYVLLTGSIILFIASIWKIKGLSKWWAIPALIVFGIAFYGNGYMIFNKNSCGSSINRTTFFMCQENLGNYAKTDGETIDFDSLKAGKYKGKLLGYSLEGKDLTVFRIGKKPLKAQTSFLFWKVDNTVILNDISHGLNTFRNFETEKIKGHYEFIGGQGMTEKDFLKEFTITQKEFTGKKLNNKRIINSKDSTTRFLFEIN